MLSGNNAGFGQSFGGLNQSTPNPFGATPTPFGQSTFGQQNTSLFSSPQANPVFGSTQQAQQPTGSTGFGTFGQQPQQQTSLFGQTNAGAAGSSIFGSNQATSTFAVKPTTFGGFGGATTPFGQTSQPQQTGGMFGQSTMTNTGGLFGSSATPAFGASAMQNSSGTAVAKYQPQMSNDTVVKSGMTSNVNTKQNCIVFMKEYEAKSLEELRLEDYMANRKGPQAGTSNSLLGGGAQQTSLFGQTSTAQNLFSQPNTMGGNTFGQPTSSFGQTNTTGGLFGKPSFSTPSTLSSGFAFGNTSTAATPFGVAKPIMGGSQAPTNTFGQPAQTNTFGSAFGNSSTFGQTATQPQTTSLFGAPQVSTAQPTFGGLGNTSAQPTFSFGQTNTSTAQNSFMNKPTTTGFGQTSTFGAQQPPASTSFSFGNTNPSGSLFNTSFNKPATSSFSFGQPQTSTAQLGGGLNLNTQSNMFGNMSKPSLFNPTSTSGGLFGSSAPPFGTSSGLSLGIGGQNTFGGPSLGQPQQQTAAPIHQQIMSLASNPYGDNPIFKDLKPASELNEASLKPTNPAAQKAALETANQFKISPKSTQKIKVVPISKAISKKSLFDGLEEYDGTLEDSFSAKPNAKRLIIKPKASPATNSTSSSNLHITLKAKAGDQSSITDHLKEPNSKNETENFQNQIPLNPLNDNNVDNGRRVSWLRTAPIPQGVNCLRQQQQKNNLDSTIKELQSDKENKKNPFEDSILVNEKGGDSSTSIGNSRNVSLSNESFLSNHNLDETNDPELSLLGSGEIHPTGITLRRPGYYTIPSLDEIMEYMDDKGRCLIPNFTIGRRGYGNVFFSEPIDVAGINLDEIVYFRHKEVILYPDDEKKPPVGEGLNRKAQVTLDQVWPHDKTLHESIKDVARLEAMNYEAKLRRVCEKHDTKFLEYRPDTGSCVFKVEHFSKYTLDDESDEEDVPVDPKKAKMTQVPVKPLGPGEKAKDAQMKIANGNAASAGIPKPHEMLPFYSAQQQRPFHAYYNDNDIEIIPEAPTSPSMALAMEMKTDSHKLQLMKASFFVEDDYDVHSVTSEMTEGRESPDQTVPSAKNLMASRQQQQIFGQHLLMPSFGGGAKQTDNFSTEFSHDFQEREMQVHELQEKSSEIVLPTHIMRPIGPKSLPLIVKPRVIQFNINDITLPLENSILKRMLEKKGNNLTFFNGRKFKVGFSGRNCFTILNTLKNYDDQKQNLKLDLVFGGRNSKDNSQSVVQIVQMKSMLNREKPEEFRKTIEDHLKMELRFDRRIKVADSDCPYFEANTGTDGLEEHYQMAKKLAMDTRSKPEIYNETVWALINSLWGYREELEGEDPTAHASIMFRRNLFSEWIENVVTDKDILQKNQEYLDQLLDLILCHKVSDACEIAFMNDDVNLAMLISQISGGPSIRQLLQHQLSAWQEVEADRFVDIRRLKTLMLIGGISSMASSHGNINIFEDLEWIKSLALQLWYLCSPTSSVTDALFAYERSFEEDEMLAVKQPVPAYSEAYDTTKKLFDLRYHLLKLYSVRSHPLETLLHPANYTPDICDFRLSFLLLQQLETLGYRHCSDLCKCKIYTSFAEQLENYGMWHWSIFVLLHIPNQSQREQTVQQLLYRYIQVDGEANSADPNYNQKEEFVLFDLGIPEKWIFWAKAVRAGAFHNYHIQAKYLLKARQWSQAHDIIMQHVAPDAINNDKIVYLKSLLQQFEEVRQISNWSNQGQILVDFIELSEKFDYLHENAEIISEYEIELMLEQLKPRLSDLCSVIKLFPCPTAKHHLCRSEISQKLAFIIRSFYATSPTYSENSCALMRIALEKLPLSQEYARQEFRHVLTAFLKEKLTIN